MRLKFDARARAILRRLPRVNVYSATELVLLAALAVQSARLMWAVFTPIAPLGAWTPAGPTLPSDPASVFATFDPFYRVSGAQPSGPAAVTPLQLTLFGTRIDGAQGGGSAIVAGPDGEQKSIAVGDEIAPGVRLKAVAFDHITLDRGGATEDLFITQPDGGSAGAGVAPTTPGPNDRVTPGMPPGGMSMPPPGAAATPPPGGSVPPSLTPAPPALTPQRAPGATPPTPTAGGSGSAPIYVNAIPRIEGGRVSGLTVRGNNSGAFRAVGFRDGDVVTQVNGRTVSGASDLLRLGSGPVSVTVERDGRTQTLTVPAGTTL